MANKLKILIVEDDELLRDVLSGILDRKYDVSQSQNGKEAKNLIVLTKFDLILSDVRMPFLTGIELLQWVKENHPTKFILMTGFSHVLETQKAQDLGADDFLSKPFADDELLSKIDKLLTPPRLDSTPVAPVNLDPDFCKVPIDDFVSEKEFQYDLYLRMGSSKYLKIAHLGGKIPQDRVQAYKEKGVHFFYVAKKDFGKLVGFSLFFSKAVANSQALDKGKKDRFLRYTGEMVLQHTFVNGLDESTFALAKDFTNLSIDTLSEDSQMLNILSNFNEHSDFLYSHSLAVSTFSVMIGHALGWTRPSMLFKLSLAGLFHDIGKKEIPKEILNKTRVELSQKERELIESHPLRGKEILESLKQIPSEVVAVAYEHHENLLEAGYPRRISRLQIHPLSNIVSVANVFAHYSVKSPTFPSPVNAREAILLMERNDKDLLDPESFAALRSVIVAQK